MVTDAAVPFPWHYFLPAAIKGQRLLAQTSVKEATPDGVGDGLHKATNSEQPLPPVAMVTNSMETDQQPTVVTVKHEPPDQTGMTGFVC